MGRFAAAPSLALIAAVACGEMSAPRVETQAAPAIGHLRFGVAGWDLAIVRSPDEVWATPGLVPEGESSLRRVPIEGVRDVVVGSNEGAGYACALRKDGDVACWGHVLRMFPLGPDAPIRSYSPIPVSLSGERAVELAAGEARACARTESGGGVCWGSAHFEALMPARRVERGTGGPLRGLTHIGVDCGVTEDGRAWVWGTDSLGYSARDGAPRITAEGAMSARAVPGLPPVVALSRGPTFACAVVASGARVLCWGVPREADLSLGVEGLRTEVVLEPWQVDGLPSVRQMACDTSSCMFVDHDGAAWALRADDFRRVERVEALRGILVDGVAGHPSSGCATSAGRLMCWGAHPEAATGDVTPASLVSVPPPTSPRGRRL